MVDSFRLPFSDGQRKASTDNYLTALEGVGVLVASKDITLLGSNEEFRMLFGKVLQETQSGVSISIEMVVAVGRNPLN